jgi:hypothetical protein
MMERIELVGTARRARKSLFWAFILMIALAAYLMYQGQVDMDAGYPDQAKLLWFSSVPIALLAFWSLIGWLGAWVVSALVVIRRD